MPQSLTPIRDAHGFGAAIRAARNARGWTQAELGRRAGLVTHHVSKIETGDTDPKLSTVLALLAALELDALLAPRALDDPAAELARQPRRIEALV